MKAKQGTVKVLTGNYVAANAGRLCRPEVVALYPITPQSEVAEQMSAYIANGELDAEIVEVEGENSAMNVVCAASMAGARTFTATSSYGLVFMYDTLLQTAAYRAPVVMVNVNRETPGIHAVSAGQQDMISTRDSGWIQIIVENNQEIMDQIIMSYRLAEDFDIQLPVMVNYDGYYLSYLAEEIEIPDQGDVDAYLAPLKDMPQRPRIIPGQSVGIGSHGMEMGYVEARWKHVRALDRVKNKIDQADKAFADYFGRAYGGQIEEYRCEDADYIIFTSGSAAGTAKTVVDVKRADGYKVGLIKLRLYRPFPEERLVQALTGKKAVGVIDRSVSFGWNPGPLAVELKSLQSQLNDIPILSYIDGLANLDITIEHVGRIVEETAAAAEGKPYQEVTWIPMEEN
jgi:pyruvate ferredoxin oxidoreductase alpha subunit